MDILKAGPSFYVRIPGKSLNLVHAIFEAEQQSPAVLKEWIRYQLYHLNLIDAIRTASPELFTAIEKWIKGSLTIEKELRLIQAIFKYILRAGSRSTPFGLFAGCASGSISSSPSRLKFKEDKYIIHARLDMKYMALLGDTLSKHPKVYHQLTYFPNNTLYVARDRYRFFSCDFSDPEHHCQLNTLRYEEFLAQILESCRSGLSYSLLLNHFTAHYQLSKTAEDELSILIEKQFFITELHPKITGKPFLDELISTLKKGDDIHEISDDLIKLHALIEESKYSHGNENQVKEILSTYIPVKSDPLIQKDLVYIPDQQFTINKNITDELSKTFGELMSLGNAYCNIHLHEFKSKFKLNYGDRMIPLMEVIDPRYGIGYGKNGKHINELAPALSDISISSEKKTQHQPWQKKHEYLLEKMSDAIRHREKKIVLKKTDLSMLSASDSTLLKMPHSLYAFGSLLSQSQTEMDKGNYAFFLNHISASPAGNLMARFCHITEDLNTSVQDALIKEQVANPSVILAEVVHLPQSKTGNVVTRPALRPYEIPILTRAGIAAQNEIPLNELLVGIKNDRVFLYSEKLNKEIAPRITNAHDFNNGIAVYQFLGDTQFQNMNFFSAWDWGPFRHQPFLPRLEYGKIIIQRARWCLSTKDFQQWLTQNKDTDRTTFIRQKITDLDIDELILMKDGNNELLLNLKSVICMNMILDKLYNRDVYCYEFIFNDENCILKNDDQHFMHELIIPLINLKAKEMNHPPLEVQRNGDSHTSIFSLGSEWLYIKIYLEYRYSDQIIADVIMPLCEKLMTEKCIDKWFYIRYKDPDHHIRLRFHHQNDRNFWKQVLEAVAAALSPYTENGTIHKFVTDTYERELKRYGVNTMQASEELFHTDSEANAQILSLIYQHNQEEYRLMIAISSIDALLSDFQYDLNGKQQLINTLFEYFYMEHNGSSDSKQLKLSLDKKYRLSKTAIQCMMDSNSENPIAQYQTLLRKRSQKNKPIASGIMMSLLADKNTGFLNTLVFCIIHMSMNRLFIINQRQHELIAYHHLAKYYSSKTYNH